VGGEVGAGLDALRSAGVVNASAVGGELSIALQYPASRWVHVLVHAADSMTADAVYDVRVEIDEGDAPSTGAARRRDALEEIGWRYRVDPDGPTQHAEWVAQRHLHPLSSTDRIGARDAPTPTVFS
jgi:hypothetical protein